MKKLLMSVFLLLLVNAAIAQEKGRYIGNALHQGVYTVGTWSGSGITSATGVIQLTDDKARVYGIAVYKPKALSSVYIIDKAWGGTAAVPTACTSTLTSATPTFFIKGDTANLYHYYDFPRPIDIRDGLVFYVIDAVATIFYSDDSYDSDMR